VNRFSTRGWGEEKAGRKKIEETSPFRHFTGWVLVVWIFKLFNLFLFIIIYIYKKTNWVGGNATSFTHCLFL